MRAASRSERTRQHLNIHQSFEEPCQRLLNAICPDSYIRPHRHALDPKTETLFAVRGTFALILFEDSGAPREVIGFGAGGRDASTNAGVELAPGAWHTVLALTDGAVLLEVKAGPFVATAAKEFAPWAPGENGPGVAEYMRGLRKLALEALDDSARMT